MKKENIRSRNCFVCGRDNPDGLNVPFTIDGEIITAQFTPTENHCGFNGIVHGGILFSLIDEAMMHLIHANDIEAITAEITIRMKVFAKAGERLTVKTEPLEIKRHLLRCSASIYNTSGEKVCEASGKFLHYKGKHAFKKSW